MAEAKETGAAVKVALSEEEEDCEVEEEPLDPRVQEELERLNARTEEINALEGQLEEANALLRTLLSDSTHQVTGENCVACLLQIGQFFLSPTAGYLQL